LRNPEKTQDFSRLFCRKEAIWMGAWEMKRQAALVGWAKRVRECRSSGMSVTM